MAIAIQPEAFLGKPCLGGDSTKAEPCGEAVRKAVPDKDLPVAMGRVCEPKAEAVAAASKADPHVNGESESMTAGGVEGEEEEELVYVSKDKFHTATCRYAKTGPSARKVPKSMAINVLQCKPCKICCKVMSD